MTDRGTSAGLVQQQHVSEPIVLSEELAALEGVQGIEVLLYILDNEGCKNVDLYALLGRSTSVQSRMDALVSYGLVRIERRPGTRANFLHLTDKGRELATILRTSKRVSIVVPNRTVHYRTQMILAFVSIENQTG